MTIEERAVYNKSVTLMATLLLCLRLDWESRTDNWWVAFYSCPPHHRSLHSCHMTFGSQ